ncbi:MAG: hypothetical protein WHX52_16550 [Anaerolineae bacterium]
MANALAVAGPNSKFQQPDAKPAGFWAGLWHGIILPITFIIRLFNPNVGIYETNNNGKWYDFGFFLGVSASFGGGTRTITVYQ